VCDIVPPRITTQANGFSGFFAGTTRVPATLATGQEKVTSCSVNSSCAKTELDNRNETATRPVAAIVEKGRRGVVGQVFAIGYCTFDMGLEGITTFVLVIPAI